jgi:hypothetical protein
MEWEEVGSEDSLGQTVHEPFNFSLLCSSSRDTSRSWQANVVSNAVTCSEHRNCPPPEILPGNHCFSQSLAQIVSESLQLSVRRRISVSAKGPATCHAQKFDIQGCVKWEQSDTTDQALYLTASSQQLGKHAGLHPSTQRSHANVSMPVRSANRSHQVCPSTPHDLRLQRFDQAAVSTNSMAAASDSSTDAVATMGSAAAHILLQLPEPGLDILGAL